MLARNLKHLLEQAQTTASAVARTTGIPQPTISRLMQGVHTNPAVDTVQPIADYFGVTIDALLNKDLRQAKTQVIDSNTREGPTIRGLVPLLTSVQAGEWAEIARAFQREDAELWLPCPIKHGPRTFALTVEGESMRNPGARPSYDPGDVIFVDPDVAAQSGDRVVARLDSQPATTFKQYLEEDGRRMLKALNPDWKPRYLDIRSEATICGVVIGKWVPE